MEPMWGRFTTRDSIGVWGDETNFGNSQSYVANSPFDSFDPFGEMNSISEYLRECARAPTLVAKFECYETLRDAICGAKNPKCAQIEKVIRALKEELTKRKRKPLGPDHTPGPPGAGGAGGGGSGSGRPGSGPGGSGGSGNGGGGSGGQCAPSPQYHPPGPNGRPQGTPDHWVPQPAKKGRGIEWVDPANTTNRDRWMPGDPDAPFPHQRNPYLRRQRHGRYLDPNGNPVPRKSPDGHIPTPPDWQPWELPLIWS